MLAQFLKISNSLFSVGITIKKEVWNRWQITFSVIWRTLIVFNGFSSFSGYTKEQVDLIRKLQNAKDHYACLDVHRHSSKEDVTKSYRRLAKLIHPDKCTAPDTENAFKILTTAREELMKLFKWLCILWIANVFSSYTSVIEKDLIILSL